MRFLLAIFFLLSSLTTWAQLQSPSDFLPHQLGSTFTHHHQLVDYVEHVAANSPRVQLEQYGLTNEDRPLLLNYISSPANLARLEAIRENNLRATGTLPGNTDAALNDIAIVWLSYSVHGNEAAGSEASMQVLYELADPSNARTGEWLENTVVILDPSLNPDGYNRYTNWYRQIANRTPDTDPAGREHNEPWPGGRVNHYLFDLNRDWAWQTQVESRQRMVKYKEWMPHVHADIHEQGVTSPYYFAPAAAPFHEYITDWQADFQTEIGKNHVGYFDREGWLYFTRERFDLLYPSYGDTYPTFNGSIGMTYEQGGSGRAGRAVDLPNGDTLTLYDRIEHHKTTSLSTVEIASKESDRLTQNFRDYFKNSRATPSGDYLAYVIPDSTPASQLNRLRTLLDRNGIEYGRATKGKSGRLYSYKKGEDVDAKIGVGDLVIPANQPRSVLTQVLFDPAAEVEDSVTYDITAWSVPMAYNLDAYASKSTFSDLEPFPVAATNVPSLAELRNAYAIVIPWTDLTAAQVLADLLKADVQVRTAGNRFSIGQATYPAGSLLVTRADNRKMGDFAATVRAAATARGAEVGVINTGYSTTGGDLGSGNYGLITNKRIAVFGGEPAYTNQFGQVWWFFEQQLNYPVTVFYEDEMSDVLSSDYDVVVLPEGRYRFSDSQEEALTDWIRGGGKLIAIGAANRALAGTSGFDLETKEDGDAEGEVNDSTRLLSYGGQERRFISTYNPGAVVQVELDQTHPLAFGLGDSYFSLKTGSSAYRFLEGGQNAGRVRSTPLISGFVGAGAKRAIEETLVFGVQDMGRGLVVYLVDNPLYRGFWVGGQLLFCNGLFLVD